MNQPKSQKSKHPRYTNHELPSYRYIPGVNKRPASDSTAHSHTQDHAAPVCIPPERWSENQGYLFGVDLYNHAYWWEAHDAWERVWQSAIKDSVHGQFLQGLIQIAAAFLKWHSRERASLERLYTSGMDRLKFTASRHENFMGLNLKSHIAKLEKHFARVILAQNEWPEAIQDYPFIELG